MERQRNRETRENRNKKLTKRLAKVISIKDEMWTADMKKELPTDAD